MTPALQWSEAFLRAGHHHLQEPDRCYFYGEYTARMGYQFSPTNNLIQNFKKPMDRKGRPEWQYKVQAVDRIARILLELPQWPQLATWTWVPAPPSKVPGDPEHDDRLGQVLAKLAEAVPMLDVRELVVQRENRAPAHLGDDRRDPDTLAAGLQIDATCLEPRPTGVLVFDDVVVSGATFRAMKAVLQEALPAADVMGLFVARRTPESLR